MNIAFGKLVTMIQIYIMMFTMVNYFDSKEKLYNVIRAFAISGLLATVYLFSVSDFSNIKRFGEELGNQNEIAIILTIAAVFSLVIYNKEKKLWYLLFWLLMVIMIFLTGSRTGFIFILLGSVITFYSSYNINLKTILPVALLIFILLISSYYAIMNIELFYNILGRRIEQMVEGAFGEGTTDGSFNTRMNMIKYGWDWFKEKPLFGYGINNYRVLYSRIGFEETYSHNNVIELLVSVGLIGTIIFYLSYLGVLVNVFKIRKEDRVL
ncbi:MAG TPA: O-antigen ligase family protein, partial [Acholeplasma sp.]|nr:O-antigen ligase family protein [Acholeplasma sp.]